MDGLATQSGFTNRRGGSPIADSIVALWDFETADQTADSAGSNTLNGVGTVDAVTGKIGDAASGFTSIDYLYHGGSVGPTGTAARTYAGWFKTNTTSGNRIIICCGDLSGNGTLFMVTIEPGGKLWIRTNNITASYGANFYDGVWHSFVISVPNAANLSDVVVYVDNAPLAAITITDGAINTASLADFGIGNRTISTPLPWGGQLDQIIIANRAWDSADVDYFHASGAGRPTAEILTP